MERQLVLVLLHLLKAMGLILQPLFLTLLMIKLLFRIEMPATDGRLLVRLVGQAFRLEVLLYLIAGILTKLLLPLIAQAIRSLLPTKMVQIVAKEQQLLQL